MIGNGKPGQVTLSLLNHLIELEENWIECPRNIATGATWVTWLPVAEHFFKKNHFIPLFVCCLLT
jgi:hypothetical protein